MFRIGGGGVGFGKGVRIWEGVGARVWEVC